MSKIQAIVTVPAQTTEVPDYEVEGNTLTVKTDAKTGTGDTWTYGGNIGTDDMARIFAKAMESAIQEAYQLGYKSGHSEGSYKTEYVIREAAKEAGVIVSVVKVD